MSDALRRLRAQQGSGAKVDPRQMALENIPPDVPMADATITAWDGEQFVDWNAWKLSMPHWEKNR
jgi:hypothetical protein